MIAYECHRGPRIFFSQFSTFSGLFMVFLGSHSGTKPHENDQKQDRSRQGGKRSFSSQSCSQSTQQTSPYFLLARIESHDDPWMNWRKANEIVVIGLDQLNPQGWRMLLPEKNWSWLGREDGEVDVG